MTQPFADALTWVPKSRSLGATFGRAHDLARAQGHAAVTLEHMLLALIEDPDASAVLLSCNVDLLQLNAAAAATVQQQPASGGDMPDAAPALLTILEYAVAAARQSKRSEINGAIVLAAIVGEGKSDAAKLLQTGGMKFEDAIQALRRSTASRPATVDAPPRAGFQPPVPMPEPAPLSAADAAHAANGHATFDDDPVTTARRRIAAIRNGQPLQPAAPAGTGVSAFNGGHQDAPAPGSQFTAPQAPPSTDWAPQPIPQLPAQAARAPRMPPPVPPVADAPVRTHGAATDHAGLQARSAPWADSHATEATRLDTLPPRAAVNGPPIEPTRLIEKIPVRMHSRAPSTVEIHIPRSAVLATAAAASAPSAQGRDMVLTRAVAVRLRAPAGGFHIENAAPETQWFDTRSAQRDTDEVRWRWLVTPHGPGRKPLQLSIAMRTIAADGMIVETMLPEHQVTVRVSSNFGASARKMAIWGLAGLAGAMLALLASGGWSILIGGLLGDK